MNTPARALLELTDEEISRVRAPLERAWTLPPKAYTSDRIYQQELDQIMRRNWIPVARIDQVAEPGQFLTLDLFGQPVMVVHGKDGEIRVMSSVCLHRGAPIAQGCGQKSLFTCPYHAWSYDTSGQLLRAPLMEGTQEFKEQDLRLPQIRSEIWEGFIFANLDTSAAPLGPQIEGFTDYFRNFKLADMEIINTVEFDSPWNWKVLVENFMEAYHHIATHSRTFEPEFHARDSKIPDNTGPWSILHMPAAKHESLAIEGLEDWQARDLFANVVFPHFLLGIHGQGAAWYQVLPTAADHLLLKIHLMAPRGTSQLAEIEEIAQAAADSVSAIHREDISANDKVWAGLNAPLTTQGRLSPLEKSIWQLNQWWLGQMAVDQ